MADHCGPALESRAACALALVRCVAARVRSRVGRHPLDPCGHPAREELVRAAQLLRLRAAKAISVRDLRGTEAGESNGGRAQEVREATGRAGARE